MTKDPWIKFYAGDFLGGVQDMSAEQIGAYIVVLAMMWDKGGPIEDDPRRIARRAGLSVRRWGQIREYLIAEGKLEVRRGMIANPRALSEMRARAIKSEKARQSALARWDASQGDLDLGDRNENYLDEKLEKNSKKPKDKVIEKIDEKNVNPAENSQTGDANAFFPSRARPYQKPEARVLEGDSTAADSTTRAPEIADQLTRIAGVRHLEPGRIIANVQVVRRWLEERIPLDLIEQTIIARAERATGNINSLAYFDPAVRQAHAKKETPDESPRDQIDRIRDPILRKYLQDRAGLGSHN